MDETAVTSSPLAELHEHMRWSKFNQLHPVTEDWSPTWYQMGEEVGLPERQGVTIYQSARFVRALQLLGISSYGGKERELFTKMLQAVPNVGDCIEVFGFRIARIRDENGRIALLIAN